MESTMHGYFVSKNVEAYETRFTILNKTWLMVAYVVMQDYPDQPVNQVLIYQETKENQVMFIMLLLFIVLCNIFKTLSLTKLWVGAYYTYTKQ